MAITTFARVYQLLDVTQDQRELVEALIPVIEADYLAIRNRPFDQGFTVKVTAGATASGTVTLTIEGVGYAVTVTAGEAAEVIARRLWSTVIAYYRTDIVTDELTIYLNEPDDDPAPAFDGALTGVTATIGATGIVYPVGAEMTAIRMLNFQIKSSKFAGSGLTSYRLGDFQVDFEAIDSLRGTTYPPSIVGSIKRFLSW